jgi:transposase
MMTITTLVKHSSVEHQTAILATARIFFDILTYHLSSLISNVQMLPHPPYSPDLAPSDFHLFWPLKDALRGRHFRSDEEVTEAVHDWLEQQPKDFFSQEFMPLWNVGGDVQNVLGTTLKIGVIVLYVFLQ